MLHISFCRWYRKPFDVILATVSSWRMLSAYLEALMINRRINMYHPAQEIVVNLSWRFRHYIYQLCKLNEISILESTPKHVVHLNYKFLKWGLKNSFAVLKIFSVLYCLKVKSYLAHNSKTLWNKESILLNYYEVCHYDNGNIWLELLSKTVQPIESIDALNVNSRFTNLQVNK